MSMSLEGKAGRPGYQTGFASKAEALREKLGVAKGELKRGNDATYFSKWLNGHIVPGWGEDTLIRFGNNERFETGIVNRGRNQVKNYVKLLLSLAVKGESFPLPLYAEDLLEEINRLLLSAEYSPLDSGYNSDDAYLIAYVKQHYLPRPTGVQAQAGLLQIAQHFKQSIAEELDRLVEEAGLFHHNEGDRAEIILYQPGVPESQWFKRISKVEDKLRGSRLYYGPYLTVFATPESVREQVARSLNWSAEQTQRYLATRRQRLEIWKAQLKLYLHQDIFEMESLQRELKERTFRGVRLNPRQLQERIELLCSYLDEYPLYQVGLSEQQLNFNFQIKADQVVLMEGRREQPSDKYYQLFGLQLSGPGYISQFQQLHTRLWQTALTDKEQIKAWLRQQL